MRISDRTKVIGAVAVGVAIASVASYICDKYHDDINDLRQGVDNALERANIAGLTASIADATAEDNSQQIEFLSCVCDVHDKMYG